MYFLHYWHVVFHLWIGQIPSWNLDLFPTLLASVFYLLVGQIFLQCFISWIHFCSLNSRFCICTKHKSFTTLEETLTEVHKNLHTKSCHCECPACSEEFCKTWSTRSALQLKHWMVPMYCFIIRTVFNWNVICAGETKLTIFWIALYQIGLWSKVCKSFILLPNFTMHVKVCVTFFRHHWLDQLRGCWS